MENRILYRAGIRKHKGSLLGIAVPAVFGFALLVHRPHHISWGRQLYPSGDAKSRVWKPDRMGGRRAGHGTADRQYKDAGRDRKDGSTEPDLF